MPAMSPYSYPVPHTRPYPPVTSDVLVAAIVELKTEFDAGRLTLNTAGRAFALTEFDEAQLVGRLAALVRAAA